MAITTSEASYEPKSVSIGEAKIQIVELVAVSGSTSGTVSASRLKEIYHIIVPGIKSHTAAPTYSGRVATLAFTVPAETRAAKTYQSALLVTAVAGTGASGNNVTVAFTAGASHGAEVVTVTGNAISIQIETTVSTATEVKAAYDASAAAVALAAMTIVSGHDSDTIAAATASALTGGINGGFRGSAICIGR